jgi:hypothetical protein
MMMTEFRPTATPVTCTGDLPQDFPSFSELFELHCALEELVTIAARDGSSLNSAAVMELLVTREGFSSISRREIQQALLQAAARAGVSIDVSNSDR